MSTLSTEKALILVEMALVFLLGQLAIFSKLGGEVGVGFLLVGIARVGVSSCIEVLEMLELFLFLFLFLFAVQSGVVGVGALALVVGALGLWSSWSFSGHFGTAFPITRINGLGKGAEFGECRVY